MSAFPCLIPAACVTLFRRSSLSPAYQVLLVKRGSPPKQGLWGLPGGKFDASLGDVTLADTAVREMREETGLDVTVPREHYCKHRASGTRFELHHFWCTSSSSNTASAKTDAAAVAWVPLHEILGIMPLVAAADGVPLEFVEDLPFVIKTALGLVEDGKLRVPS